MNGIPTKHTNRQKEEWEWKSLEYRAVLFSFCVTTTIKNMMVLKKKEYEGNP